MKHLDTDEYALALQKICRAVYWAVQDPIPLKEAALLPEMNLLVASLVFLDEHNFDNSEQYGNLLRLDNIDWDVASRFLTDDKLCVDQLHRRLNETLMELSDFLSRDLLEKNSPNQIAEFFIGAVGALRNAAVLLSSNREHIGAKHQEFVSLFQFSFEGK